MLPCDVVLFIRAFASLFIRQKKAPQQTAASSFFLVRSSVAVLPCRAAAAARRRRHPGSSSAPPAPPASGASSSQQQQGNAAAAAGDSSILRSRRQQARRHHHRPSPPSPPSILLLHHHGAGGGGSAQKMACLMMMSGRQQPTADRRRRKRKGKRCAAPRGQTTTTNCFFSSSSQRYSTLLLQKYRCTASMAPGTFLHCRRRNDRQSKEEGSVGTNTEAASNTGAGERARSCRRHSTRRHHRLLLPTLHLSVAHRTSTPCPPVVAPSQPSIRNPRRTSCNEQSQPISTTQVFRAQPRCSLRTLRLPAAAAAAPCPAAHAAPGVVGRPSPRPLRLRAALLRPSQRCLVHDARHLCIGAERAKLARSCMPCWWAAVCRVSERVAEISPECSFGRRGRRRLKASA